MKNIDRIRKMSAEELVKWRYTSFCGICKKGDWKNSCQKTSHSCQDMQIKWLESEAELTADEMFKELGYEKVEENSYKIKYTKITEYEDFIIEILYQVGGWWYGKFANKSEVKFMNYKEHEALCKKLEELNEVKENGTE